MEFSNTTSNFTASTANMAFSDISSTFSSGGILIALAIITLSMHKLKPKAGYQTKPLNHGSVLPPGPKALPIIGSLHLMLNNKPVFQWIHNMMEKMNTEISCIRLGNVHVITVTSCELAQEFLIKQDGTFNSRPVQMSTEISTYGYQTVALTPYSDQWKKMKRIVTSEILSTQRHRWLQDKRMAEADNLSRYVYNLCDAKEDGLVNVRSVTQHYCGNVIRKLMLNKRWFGEGMVNGGPGPEEIEHVNALFKILSYINAFSVSDYLPWLRVFDFEGHEGILKAALEIVKKYNDPVIDERIEMWRKGVKKQGDEWEDVLDVLIQLKDESTGAPLLTPTEIKAQILDLMLAAVDNPSNATEWALVEMLNQPKLLEKALEELEQVVGRDRQVQESDLPKLNFIKACAREAFRLHPVAPFNVPHVAREDTNVAGYFIPKGSHLLISRITVGRNPKVWNEPDRFKPDRHIKDDGTEVVLTDPKLNLISFSTGRRSCPGVLLGSTMTTMLLARLLHGFTWAAPPNVPASSLLKSNDGLTLAKPLVALATPRLAKNVYPTNI